MKEKKKGILLTGMIFLQKIATAAADVLWLVLLAGLAEEVLTGDGIRNGSGRAAGYVLGLILLSVWKRMGYSLGRSMTLKLQNRLRFYFNCQMTEKIAKIPYRLLEDPAFCELKQDLQENIDGRFVWFLVQKTGNFLLYCVRILGMSLLLWRANPFLGFLFFLLEVCHCLMTAQGKKQGAFLSGEDGSPEWQYMEELALGREGAGERSLFSYTGYIGRRCDREAEVSRREAYALSLEHWKKETAGRGLQIIACVLTEIALAALLAGGVISLGYFAALSVGVCGLIERNEEGDALYHLQRGRLFLKQWDRFLKLPEAEGLVEAEEADVRGQGMEAGKEAEEAGRDWLMREPDTLEFRKVSFRYPRTGRYVLRDLSFVLAEGGYYAFVGANGSGKTTIGKLLSGMYDNYEGEILWNGIELREIPFRERRELLAVLFQDGAKYEDTIAQNIVPGDEGEFFSEEAGRKNPSMPTGGNRQQAGGEHFFTGGDSQDVESAGEQPGTGGEKQDGKAPDKRRLAEELVREWSAGRAGRFPRGADTFLGSTAENGVILSAGEWQQLLTARLIAQPARIRVLDEPMASLDIFRQGRIYAQFLQDYENNVTLLFSHHMASVRMAKRIFVLEQGRIVEEGSHPQLICENGLYAKLYRAQEDDAGYR